MNPNGTMNNPNQPLRKNQGKNPGKKKGPLPPRWGWINTVSAGLVILFLIVSIYSAIAQNSVSGTPISLTDLANGIASSSVASIAVKGSNVDATYKDGTIKSTQLEDNSSLTDTLIHYGITPKQLSGVDINVEQPSGLLMLFESLAPVIGSILFVIFFLWLMTRQMRGAGMQVFSFGQSKARISMPEDGKEKVTFKDVAGAKEAKQELSEVVDFLKNPKKFLDIGAQIPKGILLMGAPGTGKTLLARAVAGEAGVAFFSISGSEFVEMFVGVGASRVRDLFKMAKQSPAAIIFVDEIDAVGRVRGGGVGGGNDEREQTLNQILVEMDGFEPHEKIVVMAATNRPDVLDPALLRPGRFDRRVIIDLPDRNDREEILKIHSRKKPFAEDVNLRVVAERTPGFSGADLYSLMNEGAILAARENRTKVSQYDLIRSIEKVMLGPERKSHILSKKEKEITAYHEAGHALVGSVLEYSDPVHKISIIARGHAGGYTLHLPLEDRKLQSKKAFLDTIAMSLGGYVTERMIFGDVTTGPSNDLQISTALARDMVTRYGMSDKLGAMAFEATGSLAMFGEGLKAGEFSEKVAGEIDAEVSHIMSESLKRADTAVKTHRPLLDAIAKRLIEKETIEREEFESILVAHGIQPKKREEVV